MTSLNSHRTARMNCAFPIQCNSAFGVLTFRGMTLFLACVRELGVPLTGFFERDNARSYRNWHYADPPQLPQTLATIANACDMRLSSGLTDQHLSYVASAIRTALHQVQPA